MTYVFGVELNEKKYPKLIEFLDALRDKKKRNTFVIDSMILHYNALYKELEINENL